MCILVLIVQDHWQHCAISDCISCEVAEDVSTQAVSNHPSADGLKLHHDVQGWAGCVLIQYQRTKATSLRKFPQSLMNWKRAGPIKTQVWNDFNGMSFLCFCLLLASITCFRSCNKKQNQPWRGRPPCLPALQHREPPWPDQVWRLWRCKARWTAMRACLGSMLLLFLSLRVLGVLQPDDDPNVFRFAERYKSRKLLLQPRPEKEEEGVWKQVLMHACVLDSFPNTLTSKRK